MHCDTRRRLNVLMRQHKRSFTMCESTWSLQLRENEDFNVEEKERKAEKQERRAAEIEEQRAARLQRKRSRQSERFSKLWRLNFRHKYFQV